MLQSTTINWVNPNPERITKTEIHRGTNEYFTLSESSRRVTLEHGITEWTDVGLPADGKFWYVLRSVALDGTFVDSVPQLFIPGQYHGPGAGEFTSSSNNDTWSGMSRRPARVSEGLIFSCKVFWEMVWPGRKMVDGNYDTWRHCAIKGKFYYYPGSPTMMARVKVEYPIEPVIKEFLDGKELEIIYRHHRYRVFYPKLESLFWQSFFVTQYSIRAQPEMMNGLRRVWPNQASMNSIDYVYTTTYDESAKTCKLIHLKNAGRTPNMYQKELEVVDVDASFKGSAFFVPMIEYLGTTMEPDNVTVKN